MCAKIVRIAKYRTAAVLAAGAVCAVVAAGCTDPVPQYAGEHAGPTLSTKQEQRRDGMAPPIFQVIVHPPEGLVEVPCKSLIGASPKAVRCFTKPSIPSAGRQPPQPVHPPSPRRLIPPAAETEIVVSLR